LYIKGPDLESANRVVVDYAPPCMKRRKYKRKKKKEDAGMLRK